MQAVSGTTSVPPQPQTQPRPLRQQAPMPPPSTSPPARPDHGQSKMPRTEETESIEMAAGPTIWAPNIRLSDNSPITTESTITEKPEIAFQLSKVFDLPRNMKAAGQLTKEAVIHEALQHTAPVSFLQIFDTYLYFIYLVAGLSADPPVDCSTGAPPQRGGLKDRGRPTPWQNEGG